MKIMVFDEHSIHLQPETTWEREQLQRLARTGVGKIRWEDAWNECGDLVVSLRQHPWDAKEGGGR